MKTRALTLTLSLLAASMGTAAADQKIISNWVDSAGNPIRSGYGLCWRSGFWTPETAHPDCDGAVKPAPVVPLAPVAQVPAPAPSPAAATAEPAQPVLKPLIKATLNGINLFEFDRSVIRPEAQRVLDDLIAQVQSVRVEAVVIEGHADWTGTEAYNQKLSERRADAVKTYLVQKGVAPSIIYTEGKGELEPVASNKTREGRSQNRRVEIEILGVRQ